MRFLYVILAALLLGGLYGCGNSDSAEDTDAAMNKLNKDLEGVPPGEGEVALGGGQVQSAGPKKGALKGKS
jgi:hypothetical protein